MAKIESKKGKIRLAMIGAGWIATKAHFPSLAAFDDVEFAGLCELNPEKLRETGDKYGIEKRYSDYRKMIEETAPDAVYAIGPPHHMYDVWRWCLEKGLDLFIEKPMALTIHQSECLAYLAEEHKCLTQVGFQRRISPLALKLRDECLKHGPIVHALCRFYKHIMGPTLDGVGNVMNDGTHVLDTLRWMCGGEVVSVHAACKRLGAPDINCFTALIEFDTGAVGLASANWHTGRRMFDVEMHSAGAYAQVEHEGKGYFFANGDYKGVEYDAKQVAGSDQWHVYAGYQAKNRNFIDCLKSGQQPESNFADALKTMRLAHAVLEQVK